MDANHNNAMVAPSEQPPKPEQPTQDVPGTSEKSDRKNLRRNGFVAKKPKEVRDRINRMLDDGLTCKNVVKELGDDGKGLNEDHIQSWAGGGYQDYLARQERLDALTHTRDHATDINSINAGPNAQEAARSIAAGQILELINSFNPATFVTALNDNPETYLGLVNALSRLSESEATCLHRRIQQALLASKVNNSAAVKDRKSPTEAELRDLTRQIKLI